jgi:hypothetical protein
MNNRGRGFSHNMAFVAFFSVVLVSIISRKQVATRFGDSNMAVVVRQCCVSMAVVDQHVVRGVIEQLLSVECRNEGNG